MSPGLADRLEVDVAIVGCGPTGVVLAALLGQAGVRVHVCDRLAEVHDVPRAIALDHEILRLFQQIGVIEATMPFIEPFTPSEYFGVDGQLIRRMTMLRPPYPQGYTPSVVFTQPPVERALRARLAQLPSVTVALGVAMTRFDTDDHGVSLHLSDGRVVHAAYAVACDGGASTMRARLGLALEDLGFDEPWLVVDVLVNERGLARLPATSVQYCEPDRPCTLVIGPKNHRRWEISLKPGEDPAEAATPERTWAHLARWLTPEHGTLWRQASYRFHALVAAEWRAGRMFIAGDAAHMQPPFLGQGMCQGLRDAANLAWKLAAVIQGDVQGAAAERLLDSYGAERRAHVRELTTRIKGVGAVICERDIDRARARDARLLAECGGVVQDTPRQDILPRLETGLLARDDASGRGTLFPQPRLADGRLMDAVLGHGWRLVLDATLADAPPVEGLQAIALGHGIDRDRDGVVGAWMHRHGCHAAIVRPDHYVYGTAADAAGIDVLVWQWHAALH